MAIHRSQSLIIRENYSIYEHESMSSKMLYVAMTRTTKNAHINFCNIKNYKHHTGHICSYEHHGQNYIGSTTDVNKRKQEHRTSTKAGNTKFKRAVKLYGFDNFNYEVLETIKYSNINELWELEHNYITKYNSIDNGYSIRYNRKTIF